MPKKLRNCEEKKRKRRPFVVQAEELDCANNSDEFSFDPISFGSLTNCVVKIEESLLTASKCGQDFLCVPLFHPRMRRDSKLVRQGLITRSDLVLDSKDWNSHVMASISLWIDLDSSDVQLRQESECALFEECSFANHLGLQVIVMPTPKQEYANYGRCLRHLCQLSVGMMHHPQFWVTISMSTGWNTWNKLRHSMDHQAAVHIALVLDDHDDSLCLQKWHGESVKAIILSTRQFKMNSTGNPILNSNSKRLLFEILQPGMHILIKGNAQHSKGLKMYFRNVEKLYEAKFYSRETTECERFENAYWDSLRSPLQPLIDNLQSETYKIMEKDPVKYNGYERAICKALLDQQALGKSVVRVAVVGAGRGPLVQAALNAALLSGVAISLVAVEKNRNAVITLRNRVATEKMWRDVVVLETDMRLWQTHQTQDKLDILVSELLGSWGDNELSPECLDTVQCHLSSTGVSIPSAYTSYVAPVTSAVLWNNACEIMADNKGLETPFVVAFHRAHVTHEAKPVFEVRDILIQPLASHSLRDQFSHPNSNPHCNDRHTSVKFAGLSEAVTVHGLAGYFETVLYKDEVLSTVPHSRSDGMYSWFPMFIPLCKPLHVSAGDELCVNLWRCHDKHKCWYEWNVAAPVVTAIQNSSGRCFSVGL